MKRGKPSINPKKAAARASKREHESTHFYNNDLLEREHYPDLVDEIENTSVHQKLTDVYREYEEWN